MPNFDREAVLLGEMTPLRSAYDVHYYELAIDFDVEGKALTGEVELHATATADFERIQIDLHPNLEITHLVDAATGEALKYTREERAVYVSTGHEAGDSFVLKVGYTGKPFKAKNAPWEGGFVWEKDENKNPWIGVACESDGASLWWPLKDHTSDEPDSMRLHYTVPEGLTAVGNGQLEGNNTARGRTTWNWFVSYPINTYNVTVYVGKFKLLEQKYRGIEGREMIMTHYVLEENYEVAKGHFMQLPKILRSFEQNFGPYPWYDDGFKLVESPYAGMEHQTAIAYGNGYENDMEGDYDYIIVHETAHEWWGNSITAVDLAHVWLQEGFATYAEALFLEDVEGASAYQDHLNLYRLFIANKYPVVGPMDRRWFDSKKGQDVYMKGAWILHTLRRQINDDELFREIIQEFYLRNARQIVTSQDFIDLVNEKTERDFQWFFDQYLYQHWVPELEYAVSEEGTLYYKWVEAIPSFSQFRLFVEARPMPFLIKPTLELQSMELPQSRQGEWSFRLPSDQLIIIRENDKLLPK